MRLYLGRAKITFHVMPISLTEIFFAVFAMMWILKIDKNIFIMGLLSFLLVGIFLMMYLENRQAAALSMGATYFWLLMMLSLVFGLYDMLANGMIAGIRTIVRVISLYLPLLIFEYYKRAYSQERRKRDISIFILILLMISIAQLYLYMTAGFDYARLLIGRNRELLSFVANSYGLAFGAALVGVALLEKILSNKNENKRKYIFIILICSLIVVYTKSMISTIAYAGCMLLLIIISKVPVRRKRDSMIFVFFIMLTGLLFVLTIKGEIGRFLISVSEKGALEAYSRKINEIGYYLMDGGISENMVARMDAYQISLKSIIRHPILGVYENKILSSENLIGNHSEILDTYASYGVIWSTILFGLIIFNIYREARKDNYKMDMHIVLYLIFSILNPTHFFVTYFALFFIVPAILRGWY